MPKFTVIGYFDIHFRLYDIEAQTEDDAREIAEQKAGNVVFSEALQDFNYDVYDYKIVDVVDDSWFHPIRGWNS